MPSIKEIHNFSADPETSAFRLVDKWIQAFGQTRKKEDLENAVSELRQEERFIRGKGYDPETVPEFQQRKSQVLALPNPTNAAQMVGGFNPAALKETPAEPIFEQFGYRRGVPANIPGAYNPSQFAGALGSATGTAPIQDIEARRAALNREANERFALAPETKERRQTGLENLISLIGGGQKTAVTGEPRADTVQAPARPSLEEQQRLQREYLTPLENEYNQAKADLENEKNSILAEQDKIKGDVVSSRVIERRLVRMNAERAEGLREAEARVRAAADRLETRQKTVSLMMEFNKWDYSQARDEYEFQYNKNLQLIQAAEMEENRQRDDARASLATIWDALKNNQIDPDSFTDDQRLNIQDLETKAGPAYAGMTGLIKKVSAGKIIAHGTRTDATGNSFFDFAEQTPEGIKTYSVARGKSAGAVGNTLTISEAKKLGLPTSLVGKSEAEVGRDLASETPPLWFAELVSRQLRQSVPPSTLTKEWDDFREKVSASSSKEEAAGSSTAIVNPFR